MRLPDKHVVLQALAAFLADPANENIVLHPYKDSKGIWTIGIGTTFYENGKPVSEHDPDITRERAFELCAQHCELDYARLDSKLAITLNVNQAVAVLSLIYNEGWLRIASSTLLRRLNMSDMAGVPEAFLMWDKETHDGVLVPSKGLHARRLREIALFEKETLVA